MSDLPVETRPADTQPTDTRPPSAQPPDRLSVNPKSPHHDAAAMARGVGVRFKGAEHNNVEEYCVSEGWVRLAVGKALDRRGNSMTMKFHGVVEPYFLDAAKQINM